MAPIPRVNSSTVLLNRAPRIAPETPRAHLRKALQEAMIGTFARFAGKKLDQQTLHELSDTAQDHVDGCAGVLGVRSSKIEARRVGDLGRVDFYVTGHVENALYDVLIDCGFFIETDTFVIHLNCGDQGRTRVYRNAQEAVEFLVLAAKSLRKHGNLEGC